VQLSFWKPERALIDPFCGTGTIVIEAALIGRRMAPGRNREFAAEHWPTFPAQAWADARQEADDLMLPSLPERPMGTDIDPEALSLARYHAEQAGVAEDLHFQQRAFADLTSKRQYGCTIMNPPYGIRMGESEAVEALYRQMPEVFRRLKTWSHYIFSARGDMEILVGQKADRRRKLYNAQIECTYFQFYGPRPPRPKTAIEPEAIATEQATEQSVPEAESSAASANEAKESPTSPPQARIPAFGGLRPESSRQAEEFANRLRKLARHLRRWPTKRGITCYRIYDRDIPEVPLVVDRYEDALHITEYERPHERTAAEHADWLDLMVRTAGTTLDTPPELVFVKQRTRQRGDTQYERVADQKALRVVQEGKLKFQVNLSDYVDTGLFLDHRITRSKVRDEAEGKNFLNLFAYTGAFSVYAAAGGAAKTTSVDLSSTYVQWSEDNLRLNGFSGDQHRLVCRDVQEFLSAPHETEKYDLAIVDPPTFSNSKRLDHDWDVQQDFVPLLQKVIAKITPGGVIYFSTNSRRFKLDEAMLSGAKLREISKQTVPEDFRNKRIHRCWRMIVE
jgi:23S rRNA (guanine2445-N2)-methyltransferase / 23S rRNA (guanine2069-N7)-methyltransferase